MKKNNIKPKQIMSRYILAVMLLFTANLSAQTLTQQQMSALIPKVKEVLKEYELANQFTIDGITINNDYAAMFISLFDPRMRYGIFNDLSPTNKGTLSTAEMYVNYVKTNYPQGLDVSMMIDSMLIFDAAVKKTTFTFSVKVHKRIRGLFSNQAIHRFNNYLYLSFSATSDAAGNPTNLKINGVLTVDRYAQTLLNKKWGGISLGVTGLYSQTQIYSAMLYTSDVWKPSLGSNIYPGFELAIMFTNGFGIGSGVRLSSYKTAFAITNFNNKSALTLVDKDGDSYSPVLKISDMTQQNQIKSLDIPIVLKFRGGKGNAKFYLDLGAIYSKISKSYFTLEGTIVRSGFYPSYNITLTDIPEYNFGNFTYTTDKQYQLKSEASVISGYASMGMLFQLFPGFLLKIGGGMTYGLTDLKYDQKNADNYINLTLPASVESTTLRSFGAEIGFIYKLGFKE